MCELGEEEVGMLIILETMGWIGCRSRNKNKQKNRECTDAFLSYLTYCILDRSLCIKALDSRAVDEDLRLTVVDLVVAFVSELKGRHQSEVRGFSINRRGRDGSAR